MPVKKKVKKKLSFLSFQDIIMNLQSIFVEFIGTEIFNSAGSGTTNAELDAKLQLTVLSKYKYQENLKTILKQIKN